MTVLTARRRGGQLPKDSDQAADILRSAFKQNRLIQDFGPELTSLEATVGRQDENKASDVAKVQSLLWANGYGDLKGMEGPNGFYSERDLERPLKKFQQEHNLKVDARVEPGGPTIRALSGPSVENNEHGGTSRQVAQDNSGAPSATVGKDRQTQNPAIPKSVPVPDYRSAVFKGERLREWQNWSGAVGRLPGATSREWRGYHEIYAGEGGMKLDPGSGAFAGIHPDTLKEFIGKGNFTGVKEDTQPKDLSMEQIAQFYRDYSDAALRTSAGGQRLRNFQMPKLPLSMRSSASVRLVGRARLFGRRLDALIPMPSLPKGSRYRSPKILPRSWRLPSHRIPGERFWIHCLFKEI